MLTHHLEKLILAGKASYNTFVAGGSQKHVLNVDNDRYIIITDLTYQSCVNTDNITIGVKAEEFRIFQKRLNTQLRIFSRKSFNQFLFRNNVNILPNLTGEQYNLIPFGSIKLDTYLIHEEDVSITFSYAGDRTNIDTGVSESDSIAFAPPYDYGKNGQPGALPVRLVGQAGSTRTSNSGQNKIDNGEKDLQLSFPVDASTSILGLDNPACYPILQIGYVEILGNPTNLSATL
jgi:hypothetical protein